MARGMTGFGEDAEAGFALTMGSVLGVRWFWLPAPAFYRESPVEVAGYPAPWDGKPPRLTGSTGYEYADGVAEAVCNDAPAVQAASNVMKQRPWGLTGIGRSHHGYNAGNWAAHEVPCPPCGCGFWAYWTPEGAGAHPMGASKLPVLGVVEATGRVIHGEKGLRAQKCRIVALHPAVNITAKPSAVPPSEAVVRLRAERDIIWHQLQQLVTSSRNPGASPHYARFLELGEMLEETDKRIAIAAQPDLERQARYEQAAADWSLAWMAAIEHALSVHYPQVRVYSDQDAMLKIHPPGKGYLSE